MIFWDAPKAALTALRGALLEILSRSMPTLDGVLKCDHA